MVQLHTVFVDPVDTPCLNVAVERNQFSEFLSVIMSDSENGFNKTSRASTKKEKKAQKEKKDSRVQHNQLKQEGKSSARGSGPPPGPVPSVSIATPPKEIEMLDDDVEFDSPPVGSGGPCLDYESATVELEVG